MTRYRWFAILIILAGFIGLASSRMPATVVDLLERRLRGDDFWDELKQASELIKAQADESLRTLGYDPDKLIGLAIAKAPNQEVALGGDETWLVRYWTKPPSNYPQQVTHPGELRVYLNAIGTVRRVEKGNDETRQLLTGKNLTISTGMSSKEVQERLGEPDRYRPPSRGERHLGEEVWEYEAKQSRRKKITIYFENQQVTTTSYAGLMGDFPLNKILLEGSRK